MTDDQFFWSASGQTQKLTKYDFNGRLQSSWSTFGTMPGAFFSRPPSRTFTGLR